MQEVILLKMQHKFMKNNNYLIADHTSGKAVIVDPAWEMEKVDAAIRDSGVKLQGVLLTHSHPDHIHLAGPVAEKYQCPMWMSHEEISVSAVRHERLIGIDETPWSVGSLKIIPILTPGHTEGCVCYLIGDNIFTGDVLFIEGCGICKDTDAAYEMFESLERLKRMLSPYTRIFPGHTYLRAPGLPFSQVLKENIYLQFKDKRSFAAFRLRSGQNRARMFDFS